MTALLEADNISRHFRVRDSGRWFGGGATLKAVDGVSFRLDPGRTLGVVGESGCGKSTTARLALGLLPLSGGAVRFEGEPVRAANDAAWRLLRQRMQLVFQDTMGALDRRIAVGRQILEPLQIHGIGGPDEQRAQAMTLLEAVGLKPHVFDRYPHELSGGQRQRVVLARALILKPRLIACDEPIAALDVSIQAQVINLLLDLQERFKVAYLFISHDLKVVRQVSHEVAVMYLGRIVEQGAPGRLFRQPEHPYTRALVSAIPVASPQRTRQRLLLSGDPPNPVDVPSGCAFHTRCPSATSVCRARTPELRALPDGHRVACHLAHGDTGTHASVAA
ncbi:oligopeptide/dipeptide ABC transporter ATP-binding protein [Vineibacter terrae]|uniref:ABC transporter ATP-binding protein n=1 Tax=Vineibacter terrae TaxID=2586908 RepID=UPI002E30807A|nr:oligopeptide/dipeptide ABC transporter ATP-binding protein [Vineibacter terrae]HEX2888983.1 oligopeptide/dipeptide ABC transporter ATP-binding protein [Vineibacter terrae]